MGGVGDLKYFVASCRRCSSTSRGGHLNICVLFVMMPLPGFAKKFFMRMLVLDWRSSIFDVSKDTSLMNPVASHSTAFGPFFSMSSFTQVTGGSLLIITHSKGSLKESVPD